MADLKVRRTVIRLGRCCLQSIISAMPLLPSFYFVIPTRGKYDRSNATVSRINLLDEPDYLSWSGYWAFIGTLFQRNGFNWDSATTGTFSSFLVLPAAEILQFQCTRL